MLVVDATSEVLWVGVEPPLGEEQTAGDNALSAEIPSEVMEAVSQLFEAAGDAGRSKTSVKEQFKGDGRRQVPAAIEELRNAGYLGDHSTNKAGGHLLLVSAKPWRAGRDDKFKVRLGTDEEREEGAEGHGGIGVAGGLSVAVGTGRNHSERVGTVPSANAVDSERFRPPLRRRGRPFRVPTGVWF